jgi:hypothetical protein
MNDLRFFIELLLWLALFALLSAFALLPLNGSARKPHSTGKSKNERGSSYAARDCRACLEDWPI